MILKSQFCVFLLVMATFNVNGQKTSFANEQHPKAPNFSLGPSWSALPFRTDAADEVPWDETWVSDSLKPVDVFYVHPTIYQRGPMWNASLDMKRISRKVDRYPVRLQASVFNKHCRVYAPRYRQAVVKVFYDRNADGDSALDLAYQDVKRAFNYYLEHYNQGRPFIIAGHSQGTYHTRRLLWEMVDTTDLREQLVAAYVIGFNVNDSMYSNLKICDSPEETGCYISYMSYKEGFQPTGFWYKQTESVNPLTWTMDTSSVSVKEYDGTVVLNPKRRIVKEMTVSIVEVGGKVLWVKTKAPWFRSWKSLHVADYGLFYHGIRKNVGDRVDAYLRTH